jgi:hypothetical protein
MKTLYTCGVDWQHEIGEASDLEGSMPFYSSIELLKKNRPCWKECGIIELKVNLAGWVVEQNLLGEVHDE